MYEDLLSRGRTGRRREWACLRIDSGHGDPFRPRKRRNVAIARTGHGPFHEFRPYRGCRCGAGKAQLAVVVKPDPNDAEEVRGKARKPAVARGPGLSGRGGAESEGPHNSPGPPVDYIFENVGDEIRHARVEDRTPPRLCPLDR